MLPLVLIQFRVNTEGISRHRSRGCTNTPYSTHLRLAIRINVNLIHKLYCKYVTQSIHMTNTQFNIFLYFKCKYFNGCCVTQSWGEGGGHFTYTYTHTLTYDLTIAVGCVNVCRAVFLVWVDNVQALLVHDRILSCCNCHPYVGANTVMTITKFHKKKICCEYNLNKIFSILSIFVFILAVLPEMWAFHPLTCHAMPHSVTRQPTFC